MKSREGSADGSRREYIEGLVGRSVREWKNSVAIAEQCHIHLAQVFRATESGDLREERAVRIQISANSVRYLGCEQSSHCPPYPRIEDRETPSADEMQ